jgi:hypothetical protein
MAVLIRAASPIWRLVIICASILGAVLLVGGILLAILGSSAETTIKLLGSELSSTSVGVALAFIGAILVAVTLGGVLASLNKVTRGEDQTNDTEARRMS